MSWRLGLGVAFVALVSVAAVVVAIMSVGGAHGAEQVKDSIRWPTNCTSVAIKQPSHAAIVTRWASSTVNTADIVCTAARAGVAYAQFRSQDSLEQAIAVHEPSKRYCLLGASIVIDELAADDATVFTDMCRNLAGTFVNGAR